MGNVRIRAGAIIAAFGDCGLRCPSSALPAEEVLLPLVRVMPAPSRRQTPFAEKELPSTVSERRSSSAYRG